MTPFENTIHIKPNYKHLSHFKHREISACIRLDILIEKS